jgi:hypothetical protein
MIFGVKHPARWMVKLSMRPYGKLEMSITGRRDPVIFDKAPLPKSRWTHVTLVYHYGKGVSPAIRLFIDGHLADSSDIPYPRLDNALSTVYFIGDDSSNAQANLGTRFCLFAICNTTWVSLCARSVKSVD